MESMRKLKIMFLIIFCLILSAGASSSVLLSNKKYSDRENRELAEKPDFSKKAFMKGKYQKRYEKWLNDRFVFRDGWSALAVNMQGAMGKKEINGVYLGKNGYLLEKYSESDFDGEQVEDNVETLSLFLNDAAGRYGKEHVSCIMVPSKTEALAGKLPMYSKQWDTSGVREALKKQLEQPECLLYAGDFLKDHQEEYIYYRTDHHWTTLGAYYVWDGWAANMGYPNMPVEKFQRETIYSDFYGTTYNKAQMYVKSDSIELFHSPAEEGVHVDMDDGELEEDSVYFREEAEKGFNRYNIFFGKNTFKVVVTTRAATGRTLLLFKDSFANSFVPFLLGEYDRIIMIDYRYGKIPADKLIKQYPEITDILVLFNTEKFMQNTKLNFGRLEDTDEGKSEMEEFNPDDFMDE